MTLAVRERLAGPLGLAVGFGLDQLLGDPRRGHPVAGFGAVAARLERHIWADRRGPGVARGCWQARGVQGQVRRASPGRPSVRQCTQAPTR